MTPLEIGLTVAARREKKTWELIAEALYREPRTLQRAIRNKKFLREQQDLR